MTIEEMLGSAAPSSPEQLPPASMSDRDTLSRCTTILRNTERLLVLSGAGISAESGIPTYGGLTACIPSLEIPATS
jgi:hypothetical protein